MNKIITVSIIFLILLISGCVQNNNINTVPRQDLAQNSIYIGTMGSIDLYQFRIESINATCIYGDSASFGGRAVLDCKYD